MKDQDHSYRPRSPDFSGFPPSPYDHHHTYQPYQQPPPPHQYHRQQYQPPAADPYAHYPPYTARTTPQASYDASPFFHPAPQVAQRQQYVPPQLQQQLPPQQLQQLPPEARRQEHEQQQPHVARPLSLRSYHSLYDHQHPEMPPQTRSSTRATAGFDQHEQYQSLQQKHFQQQQQQHQHHHQPQRQPPFEPDPVPMADEPALSSQQPPAGPGPSQGIEIKTKFPVARIKRIMQADEDVGKVAQATPIAVAKALELFMINLVTKAADQAKDRSSKRITATHLKDAVVKDDVLDFLADIMAKVPDQQSGGRKQGDEEGDHHSDGRRRRGGGAGGGGSGRRKRDDVDDGF